MNIKKITGKDLKGNRYNKRLYREKLEKLKKYFDRRFQCKYLQ